MELTKARYLCVSLMSEFGVWGEEPYFRFKWANGKRTLGSCHHVRGSERGRYISLSKTYVKLNNQSLVEDTIRHEIAHALDVLDRGDSDHGFNWRLKCQITGANPSRLKSGVTAPPHKYVDECSCGRTYKRHRISYRSVYSCPTCKDVLFTGKSKKSGTSGARPVSNVQYKLSTF
jgi:predicted SprT family Zn-dependent metalloprotease